MPAFAGIHDLIVERYDLRKSWIPGSAGHDGVGCLETSVIFKGSSSMRVYDEVLRDHVALVTSVAAFAARRHSDQRRKGAAAEPYILHLAEVAELLATTAEEPDAYLVAAGWLHDTLEDTATTRTELEDMFGGYVTGIVLEVTDDKSLPKDERKRLQVVRTPQKSESARLVKLADKTSNLRALADSPPKDWSIERCETYVDWARQVAASCLGLNADLDLAFESAATAASGAIAARSVSVSA